VNNYFQSTNSPTKTQNDVLQDLIESPNKIITGAAGCGKTQTAIFLAELLMGKGTVTIIVFTKALRTFIEETLQKRGNSKIKVFHYYKWFNNSTESDYVLIDEVQDFSLEEIRLLIKQSKYGVYLFGDNNQRIYNTSLGDKNPTITIEKIKAVTGFPSILLQENIRLNKNTAKFINQIYREERIKDPKSCLGDKIKFINCISDQEELHSIATIIKQNEIQGTTCICLRSNDGNENGIKIRPGIIDVFEFLKSHGVNNVGYKFHSSECYNYDLDSINILTYHSTKGLEFDNIIIPFFDKRNSITNHRLNYTIFTRSRKKIIITYTNEINSDLPFGLDSSLYEGEYKRPLLSSKQLGIIEFKILFLKYFKVNNALNLPSVSLQQIFNAKKEALITEIKDSIVAGSIIELDEDFAMRSAKQLIEKNLTKE
jgi:superfamily I DNA and RNA helicase